MTTRYLWWRRGERLVALGTLLAALAGCAKQEAEAPAPAPAPAPRPAATPVPIDHSEAGMQREATEPWTTRAKIEAAQEAEQAAKRATASVSEATQMKAEAGVTRKREAEAPATRPAVVPAPVDRQEAGMQREATEPWTARAKIEAAQKAEQTAKRVPASVSEATQMVAEAGADAARKSDFSGYSANIAADEKLQLPGHPGQMRVWIGDPQFVPAKEEGMSSRTESLGVRGTTAKVEPFVLGKIAVEPAGSKCGRIVPSGSTFQFKLTPQEAGHFTVGAKVELFDSPDCTGSPTMKSPRNVQVEVEVCTLCLVNEKLGELLDRAWKALLEFWDKLLLLVFALLLFLVRKKLYKWFGFKGE